MKKFKSPLLKGWFGSTAVGAVFVGGSNVVLAAVVQFDIDFKNDRWFHHAGESAPVETVGWNNNATSRMYASGYTTYAPGVTLTVTDRFVGTAAQGVNNFTQFASNTPGFAFQNAGTGDKNTTGVLLNYHKIDFVFSTSVTMDHLELLDIDTSGTGTGVQAWKDAAALEMFTGTPGANGWTVGSGFQAPVHFSNPTNLGTFSIKANNVNQTQLQFVAPTKNVNTQSLPTSTATFGSGGQTIDGFSIYLWNNGAGTGGKHAIVLKAGGSQFTVVPDPVPEPSGAALIGVGGVMLLLRRCH